MGGLPSRRRVRFGSFEMDEAAGELFNNGAKIKLPEQPLRILQILLEQPGKLISREELCKRLWPDNTFVDFDHGINNAIMRLREALGDNSETPRFIETLPRRGYRFTARLELDPQRIRSLAVLPLANLSHDPEQEYFAEGLTEALVTTLAKIGELRVVSRTSSMLYKNASKPLPQIARELGVDAVVEGTVLRVGDRVRITAQLIDAARESHLWAESYERNLRDVLTLQADIAQAIAHEIQIKLTPQDRTHLGQVHAVNPEAYESYLQGRYHWNRRSGKGFAQAIQFFQQAIAKDSAYAAAYSGLADCLTLIGSWGAVPPASGAGKAKSLALKALAIDSSLAEAHTSLAFATMFYDYDFATAEREFERSIELNPRYATAHEFFGICLAFAGRFEEGYTELQRAIRLDPLSGAIRFALGCVYWSAHRFDDAMAALEKAIELDPGNALAHSVLGYTLTHCSQNARAIAELQYAMQLAPESSTFIASLGEVYAAAGHLDEARKILEQLVRLSTERYVSAYPVARIYMALGDKEQGFRWLERGYEERAAMMIFMKLDPRFAEVHSDPRFQDLLRRMNLSE
jgi:TolB-like protein/Tfp pilus assembly protein PilF